jgi:serine/threonine-protein kinase HipA
VTYDHYLTATRSMTHDHRAVVQAFRRMVFNVLAHNRDDHVKNFAFLMEPSGTWTLSPAYDLTYMQGPNGEHSMMVDTEGARPTKANLLAVAGRASIPAPEATAVVEEVAASVERWSAYSAEVDVRPVTRKRIGAAIKRVCDHVLAS